MTAPDVNAGYSELAPAWDTSGADWNKPVAERLVALAALAPGMHVLDVGCGAGRRRSPQPAPSARAGQ
jgi:ubiquinone/menaquinone biosynthesis C-methylase UbiE